MQGNSQRATIYLRPIRTRALSGLAAVRSRMDGFPLFPTIWSWKYHLMELGLIVGFYLVYLLTRGVIFSDDSSAGLANAGRVISAEQALGFFWEPAWQSWILANVEALAAILNWTYIFTYWPIIMVVGLALYVGNRAKYYYYRTVVAINLVFALLIFMVFPVTSPFNVTAYFVNTIQQLGPMFYGSPEMASFYNTDAAMPSLHFSWTVILGVLFVRSFKGWFKVIGVAYPLITFLAITITGNHFILDAAAGGLLAIAAFAVMELGFRGRIFRVQQQLVALWNQAIWQEWQYRETWPHLRERFLVKARANVMQYRETWLNIRVGLQIRVRANAMQYREAWLRVQDRMPVAFRRRPLTRRRTATR